MKQNMKDSSVCNQFLHGNSKFSDKRCLLIEFIDKTNLKQRLCRLCLFVPFFTLDKQRKAFCNPFELYPALTLSRNSRCF